MKKINSIIAGLIILSATGCSNPEKTVSVRDVYIEGSIECNEIEEELEDYVTVDDGSYTFWIEDDVLMVNIPFKKTNSLPENIGIAKINEAYLSPYDESGNSVATQDSTAVEMKIVNVEDLKALLDYTWVGDYKRLTFKFAVLGEKDILDRINSFDITFEIDFKEKENLSDSSDSDAVAPAASSGTSSSSYSEILDEYEDYMKQLQSMMKKASKGDLSAITDYAGLLKKAESLSEKLEGLEDEMTPADLKKLGDLQSSMLDLLDTDLDLSSSLNDLF